jgi:simple sugar transport system permease protein
VPAILLAGVLGGMAWAGITALLRDRFNANEILVSLMLVYVAEHGAGLPGLRPLEGPGMGYNFPQTKTFDAVTQIPRLMQGSRVSIGLLLALAAVGAVGVPVPHLPGLCPAGGRAGAGGGALRRLFVAQGAVDGAADFGRRGRPGRCAGGGRADRPAHALCAGRATALPPSSWPLSGGCTRWAWCFRPC